MPSPILFHDFRRKFEAFGVRFETGRGSHWKMEKVIDGVRRVYIVPVHQNKVAHIYLTKARRRFALTPDDGVSDAEFNKA